MKKKILEGRRAMVGTRKVGVLALLPLMAVCLVAFAVSASATTPTCGTLNVLNTNGNASTFEIDTDANLVVNGAQDCIDWLTGGTGTGFRTGVSAKNDQATGSGDDSFGQGTSEDNANPTIVSGSIPPNKSDLKAFGAYSEASSPKTLELFWSRVQNPSGTTNMDFELNQKFCDGTAANCANNGTKTPVYVTPKRTAGDKLVTYDLSKGGTVPTISIRTWTGSAWGPATVIGGAPSATSNALGTVNTTTIPANQSGGATGGLTASLGTQDPYTFGEAAISYTALFPTGSGCTTLGSAYLKSRSSDSFTSEVKDFVAPERVTVSNCATITTLLSADAITVGGSVNDTAALVGASANAGGTVTYTVYTDSACTLGARAAGVKTVTNGTVPASNSLQFNSVGDFYWQAVYSGDSNNSPATSVCTDEHLVVNPASPTLGTTPSAGGTVGVTLNDSATLSGGSSPTGSIVFSLWDPDQSTCTGTPRFTQTVALTGSSASTTGGFATDKAGTWRWTASYAGDSNNNTASSGCTAEQVTVTKASPTLGTTPNPSSGIVGATLNDSGTLTNAFSPTGSIVFSLWDPDQSTCAGTPRFTQTVALTGSSASTTGGFATDKVGTWRWTASYAGDANNDPASSGCSAEQVTIGQLNSTIATAQKWFPQDSTSVTGQNNTSVSGTVTFSLYKNDATCGGTNQDARVYGPDSQTVDASGNAKTDQNTFSVSSVGAGGDTYYWKAAFSGDTTHKAVASCNEATTFTSLSNGSPVTSS